VLAIVVSERLLVSAGSSDGAGTSASLSSKRSSIQSLRESSAGRGREEGWGKVGVARKATGSGILPPGLIPIATASDDGGLSSAVAPPAGTGRVGA